MGYIFTATNHLGQTILTSLISFRKTWNCRIGAVSTAGSECVILDVRVRCKFVFCQFVGILTTGRIGTISHTYAVLRHMYVVW